MALLFLYPTICLRSRCRQTSGNRAVRSTGFNRNLQFNSASVPSRQSCIASLSRDVIQIGLESQPLVKDRTSMFTPVSTISAPPIVPTKMETMVRIGKSKIIRARTKYPPPSPSTVMAKQTLQHRIAARIFCCLLSSWPI